MVINNPQEYDQFYIGEQVLRENREIKRILHKYIPKESCVLDIGSGTGLGYILLDGLATEYTGVEINTEKVQFSAEKYRKNTKWVNKSAEIEIKQPLYYDAIISLSSINYMEPEIIADLFNKAKTTIIVHYNKPYLSGSSSEYWDNKERFKFLHQENKRRIREELMIFEAKTFRLCNQEYYWVSIIEKYEM